MDQRKRNLWLAEREKKLLPLETKGDINVILAYPNHYWVAMSNLGFQTIYRLLCNQPRFKVDRAYIPENLLEQCRTFENNTRLSTAAVLAISVSFETDYSNVVRLVAEAGLDLTQCWETLPKRVLENQGRLNRPLIIGGGAAITLNPEPLANFFDAIVIGEGEEVLQEIAELVVESREKDINYLDLLFSLAKIEGVYVPSLFKVQYRKDQTIGSFLPYNEKIKKTSRRYLANLDLFPSTTVIQTPETEFKSMYMTETGRGCEVGCRFCVSGYMYRPTRKRKKETIAQTVKIGVEAGESVGFVGAAVSSHPAIAELASSVAQQGKRAALSSIMSQKVTSELASSLSESEYKTVALAPEAGSEKLRFKVGKRVCNDQVVEAVGLLAAQGIRNFKLYLMVGLPGETEEDVEAIPLLVKEVQEKALSAARKMQSFTIAPKILLSINPFIPKAWTPFQRHPFLGFKELKRRLGIVKQGIKRLPNVEMNYESPKESYFQALLSRGDRRVGDLLIDLHVHRDQTNGEVNWKKIVSSGDNEILRGVPPAEFYVMREFGEGEILPWEIVDLKIKRSLLEREYKRAFEDDVNPLIIRAKKEFLVNNEVRI